jgi:hypothetical protein
VKKTKNENLLAGSTSDLLAGKQSLPAMKDGDETPAMLLALLNSPLVSMINSQQAKFVGTGLNREGKFFTLVMFYGVEPTTANTLQSVGKKEMK